MLLTAAAIACSILTILSCDFFRLVTTVQEAPANLSGASSVGIFSYSTEQENGILDTATCQTYATSGSLIFQPSDWMGAMWIVAQYAALLAPCLAACATLLTAVELLFGKFFGSFLLPLVLYLLAFAVQGLTFFMYNEKNVCFRLDTSLSDELIQNSCQLSSAAFLSMTAGFSYYICTVLICCLPRPLHHCVSYAQSKESASTGIGSDPKRRPISLEERSEVDMEAPTVSGWTRSTASLSHQQ